jgi:hypothetical protein
VIKSIGGACDILGRNEEHARFWWGNWKEGDHLKNLAVDGRINIKSGS